MKRLKEIIKSGNYLFYLLCVSLPFHFKISNVIIVALFVHVLINYKKCDFNVVRNYKWLYYGYFIILLVGMLYTTNFSHGMKTLETSLFFIAAPLIFAYRFNYQQSIKFIYLGAILSISYCIFYAIYLNYLEGYTLTYLLDAIINDVPKQEWRYKYFNYWYFSYEHFTAPIKLQPIYFGLFLNCVLVLLLFEQKLLHKKKYIIILLAAIIALFLTSSRSQILFCCVYVACHVFYLVKSRFNIKLATLSFLLAIATMTFVILSNPINNERIKEIFKKEQKWGGTNVRFKKWQYATETFQENILGSGTGDGKDKLMEKYRKYDFKEGLKYKFNAHNQFLETSLQTGIIGFLFLILFFIILFRHNYKHRNTIMLVILILMAYSFFSESILERNKGVLYFCFFTILTQIQWNLNRKMK